MNIFAHFSSNKRGYISLLAGCSSLVPGEPSKHGNLGFAPRRQEREEKMMHEDEIGKIVVDAAIAVHRGLGPGLLETVYEMVLTRELQERGLKVERQVPIRIAYRGLHFEEGFRADVVVEGKVILELKSVEEVVRVHKKQLLTYLRLTGLKLGLLLNFGETLMKDGITRLVNCLDEPQRNPLGDLGLARG